jgi:hypothetical protein
MSSITATHHLHHVPVAYAYSEIDALMMRLRMQLSLSQVTPTVQMEIDANVMQLLQHPHTCRYLNEFWNMANNASARGLLGAETQRFIASNYPSSHHQASQQPHAQTNNANILATYSDAAVSFAVSNPDILINNINTADVHVAIDALRNKRVRNALMQMPLVEQRLLLIITPLFTRMKRRLGALEDLFDLLSMVACDRYSTYGRLTLEEIRSLLDAAPVEQRTHHVLMAWSCGLISDRQMYAIVGTARPRHMYNDLACELVGSCSVPLDRTRLSANFRELADSYMGVFDALEEHANIPSSNNAQQDDALTATDADELDDSGTAAHGKN